MFVTDKVRKILSYYDNENIGVLNKLAQLMMHGKLSGSGNLVIMPVDQGLEHGPARSFMQNKDSCDPEYHFKLAVNAGLNAYAAPIGMIEAAAKNYVGEIPTILKLNSSNLLYKSIPDQAMTASIDDALKLGCIGIGLTIYPGSENSLDMISEAREIIAEAKSYGLLTVIWSYPRGGELEKKDETAVDVCAYAAYIAASIGAHIIKIKPPSTYISDKEAQKIYKDNNINLNSLSQCVSHIMKSCFNRKRIIIFSGGTTKSDSELLNQIQEIKNGGGYGSIIGRNSFQRPYDNAINLLDQICNIYKKDL